MAVSVLLSIFCVNFIQNVNGRLWPKATVFYAIDNQHYEQQHRELIYKALFSLQNHICIKFLPAGENLIPSKDVPLLYISNPTRKDPCMPQAFDFRKPIVKLTLGYKCFRNIKAVADQIINMLKLTVPDEGVPVRYENKEIPNGNILMSKKDRDFINNNYDVECQPGKHRQTTEMKAIQSNSDLLSLNKENREYYKDKIWPMGVIYYDVELDLRFSKEHQTLIRAMNIIEKDSCIKFHDLAGVDPRPNTIHASLFFGADGFQVPPIGYRSGNTTIKLQSMINGPHKTISHTLNLLMRILGVGMMSNRADRNNNILINWDVIDKRLSKYLDKEPKAGWIELIPYDYASVTHAPYDFICFKCQPNVGSIKPLQNDLWKYKMGFSKQLSSSDKILLQLLYKLECDRRQKQNIKGH